MNWNLNTESGNWANLGGKVIERVGASSSIGTMELSVDLVTFFLFFGVPLHKQIDSKEYDLIKKYA